MDAQSTQRATAAGEDSALNRLHAFKTTHMAAKRIQPSLLQCEAFVGSVRKDTVLLRLFAASSSAFLIRI